MDNIQTSPRTALLGYIADALKSGKSAANRYEILPQVPLLGGTGLGDLFMGNSPELVDDMSYNLSSAIRGGNRATGGIGTYTLDKRSADLGMVMADIYGLSKGLTSLGKYGARKLMDKSGFDAAKREFLIGKTQGLSEPINVNVEAATSKINDLLQKPVNRRNVLKGSVVAAGGAAALSSIPPALRNILKGGGETAVHGLSDVADNVATHVPDNIAKATTKYKFNNLDEYFKDVENRASHNMYYQDEFDFPELFRNRLKADEDLYNLSKSNGGKTYNSDRGYKILTNDVHPIKSEDGESYLFNKVTGDIIDPKEHLNAFSPQAKQEMKNWKTQHGDSWSDFSSDRSLDLYELERGFYQ